MSTYNWVPWYCRDWFRYPVARIAHFTFAGTHYQFARRNGRVVKFWTRKGAQAYADQLNAIEVCSHD